MRCNSTSCTATIECVTQRLPVLRPLFVLVVLAALFLPVAYAGSAASTLPAVPATVESITPAELRMHLEFLASSELGGRYTLSPSFAVAARYLAAHLKAYGFHGAGTNGDFLQFFDVASSKPDTAKSSLSCTINGQTSSYKYGDFFTFGEGSNADVQGQVVFVGYGVSSPSQKH